MYYLKKEEVFEKLNSSSKGLTEIEIKKRLKEYGKNELRKKIKLSAPKILLKQFTDTLIIILIIAAVISGLLSEYIDAIAIAVILIINAIIGFVQEYKAEKAIELLKQMRALKAKVLRNGKQKEILSENLVPGDIILLEEGDKVPADARLLKIVDLHVDESALTGESVPVVKEIKVFPQKTALGDRLNMVFSGTIITQGRAEAIVTGTGHDTEIGHIANMVQEIKDTQTPLQKRLKHLGNWITVVVGGLAAIILLVGVLEHISLLEAFMVSVSLAVSAIPEGLPAVVTIVLALGLRRMLKRKALIRKLKAVETLGSVTVIASDKTGTITKNEMTVTQLYTNNKIIKVTGKGYLTEGKFLFNGKIIPKTEISKLLIAASSCNNAVVGLGDPTEISLIVAAAKAGIKKRNDRVSEIPFDSEKKYMATTHKNGLTYVKGAPERILDMCSFIEFNGNKRRILDKDLKKIFDKNEEMGKNALRVLGVAYGEEGTKNLVFLGLMGMIDPEREGVKDAIRIAHKAGIRTMMITGDHKITARAIANKVGIKGESLEGKDLDKISNEKLKKIVKKYSIFARVSSAHKVRILHALQENGEVVAMTGDGVNDAPALKKADVGVAMNLKGTDVSREVADIILMDDNYVSIVSAVREGRIIYDNIKKFIKFLLSANFDEVVLVLFTLLLGLPLPLLPLQLLWVNLVTDSLPALALGMDPRDKDIMRRKPRNPKESIFKNMKSFLVFATVLGFLASVIVFFIGYGNISIEKVRTMVLTTVIMFEVFLVFSCRSEDKSIFKLGLFSNKYLVGAVGIAITLQLIAIYTPLANIFSLVPLGVLDWLWILLLSCSGFVFFEMKKILWPWIKPHISSN